jgi:Glutathione S-transferase, N-terminal domain
VLCYDSPRKIGIVLILREENKSLIWDIESVRITYQLDDDVNTPGSPSKSVKRDLVVSSNPDHPFWEGIPPHTGTDSDRARAINRHRFASGVAHTPTKGNKASKMTIIVHHLDKSRSHRILWLLEELNVPYEIKQYKRLESLLAPPELKKIHPLGKAPVIENTETKEVLAESGAIVEVSPALSVAEISTLLIGLEGAR